MNKKKRTVVCIGVILVCVCAGMSKLEVIPCLPEDSELKSGMYSSSSFEAWSDSSYVHQIEVRTFDRMIRIETSWNEFLDKAVEVRTFDRMIRIETPNGWIETTFVVKKNFWGDYVMVLDEKHLNDTKMKFSITKRGEITALSDFTESDCNIKRNEKFIIYE